MTDDQIDALVSDIIKSADYDIWKGLYLDGGEDPDQAARVRAQLRRIAREHIERAHPADRR